MGKLDLGPLAHLALRVDGLVVESRAHDVEGRHGQHHHHAADHAGAQSNQPAVLREHLESRTASVLNCESTCIITDSKSSMLLCHVSTVMLASSEHLESE